jgi:hypothetical protein
MSEKGVTSHSNLQGRCQFPFEAVFPPRSRWIPGRRAHPFVVWDRRRIENDAGRMPQRIRTEGRRDGSEQPGNFVEPRGLPAFPTGPRSASPFQDAYPDYRHERQCRRRRCRAAGMDHYLTCPRSPRPWNAGPARPANRYRAFRQSCSSIDQTSRSTQR